MDKMQDFMLKNYKKNHFWKWAQNWAALFACWVRAQDFLEIERERKQIFWAH